MNGRSSAGLEAKTIHRDISDVVQVSYDLFVSERLFMLRVLSLPAMSFKGFKFIWGLEVHRLYVLL